MSNSSNNINSGNIQKINIFDKEVYKNNNLENKITQSSESKEDAYKSGIWKADYKASDLIKYKNTLGGLPVSSYDPNGFLKKIGLPEDLKAPGRTDEQLFNAHKLTDFKPDPQYFPGPKWLASPLQKGLIKLAKLTPKGVTKLDSLATKTVIKKMETADTIDPNPFGKENTIAKGEKLNITSEERYFGIVKNKIHQYAWDEGVHTGSIRPDLKNNEKFGTYDIALKVGFTDLQARNISLQDFDVDENDTHYHEHNNETGETKPRITHSGTGGDSGDFHWHFNRNEPGKEDTRITAAKTHLERALKFAKEGYYDTAEKELGIGLHSLQDMFSHGQITPINHTILGAFPDFVKWNPVGMYETAMATEGYLNLFINELNMKTPESISSQIKDKPISESLAFIPGVNKNNEKAIGNILKSNTSLYKQIELAMTLNNYPTELLEVLDKNNITIYLGSENTKLTDLGFGADLDKDGKITPDKWVDINKDSQKQNFEIEGNLNDNRKWNEQKAAYNNSNKLIFISESLLKNPNELNDKLKHEIEHAFDFIMSENPEMGNKWKRYVQNLYNSARREGEINFDQLEPHEFLAEKNIENK